MKLQDQISSEREAAISPAEGVRRKRVLLAEDDRAVRRLLEVVLERAGYEVTSAADGLEAMKLVLSEPIDVVITDAMMPNLSGHEFCRFIRNSPALSHLPVILLSALERKDRPIKPANRRTLSCQNLFRVRASSSVLRNY